MLKKIALSFLGDLYLLRCRFIYLGTRLNSWSKLRYQKFWSCSITSFTEDVVSVYLERSLEKSSRNKSVKKKKINHIVQNGIDDIITR